MRLAVGKGNGTVEAAHSQAAFWQQQETHRSNSGSFNGAKFKAQKTKKGELGKPEILQRRSNLGSLRWEAGTVFILCVYYSFCVCLKKKD